MVLAVVAWRGDLLGARLSNWLNAWRFASKLDCQTLVVWRNTDENRIYPYDLYTLFDRVALDSIPSMRVQLLNPPADIRPYHWKLPSDWSSAQWIDIEKISPDSYTSLPDDGLIDYFTTSPKYFPNEDLKTYQIELGKLFRSLPIHSDIEAALARIGKIIVQPFAAVHLRRGNLVDYLFKRVSAKPGMLLRDIINFVPRYSHLNNYLRALQCVTPANMPVIIFSDDLDLRVNASKKINRRIVDIHKILDECRLSELQRAFVEFLLISKAQYVIGAKSQFSILPAKIGDAFYIDARKYAEAAEVFEDLRPLILSSQRVDASPRELQMSLFSEFSKMYERINTNLSIAFAQLADRDL